MKRGNDGIGGFRASDTLNVRKPLLGVGTTKSHEGISAKDAHFHPGSESSEIPGQSCQLHCPADRRPEEPRGIAPGPVE